MADLDVEIDVPDDDDPDEPIRVVGGGSMPSWLKTMVAVFGVILVVTVGAYLYGRSRATDDIPSAALTVPSTTSSTATIDSALASSGIERSLAAVDAWQGFAGSGDLAPLADHFDPEGPQYSLFEAQSAQVALAADSAVDGGEPPPSPEFSARNLSETTSEGIVTVSLDLTVTGPDGETTYPYQFVYLAGESRVWTVVDRRTPDAVAVPPPAATVDLAQQNWSRFAAALAADDGAGAASVVSEATRQLSAAVAGGEQADDSPIHPELFGVLVERAATAGATTPDEVLLTLLDDEQRAAVANGVLTLWTQVEAERIIATLQVDGQAVATVPFGTSAEGWVFDLAGALGTSQGASQ